VKSKVLPSHISASAMSPDASGAADEGQVEPAALVEGQWVAIAPGDVSSPLPGVVLAAATRKPPCLVLYFFLCC
jgi:hypothetical protein